MMRVGIRFETYASNKHDQLFQILSHPIIKAHPQAGMTFDMIGTFGHAISLENEIEVRAKSEQRV